MNMPETPEIETDKLREAVQEELERGGGGGGGGGQFLRRIALTTAVVAAVAAIAALKAGSTANEALVLKTEATRLQAVASDQWAYYQAKGIKLAVAQATEAPWRALGKRPPGDLVQKQQKYAAEQEEIKTKAEALERERDARSHEADHLLHQHHGFANAVALFQVAIALGALAALTHNRLVWIGSLSLGGVGLAFFVAQFLS